MHADWKNLSIVDWELRAGIVTFTIAVFASSRLLLRRRTLKWIVRAACIPLIVLYVAVAINAHYDYFPTAGALLGRNAADEVSAPSFSRLVQRYRHAHGHARGDRRVVATSSRDLPARGVVISFPIPGTVSHFAARTAHVYLPPAWFADPHPRLPVVELLHGSPGSPADWTRGSAADLTADTFAATHDGYAPILVMPDVNGSWRGDTECVNGPRGNAETYLTTDVRSAVVRAFDARADGASWAVAGLSEGGSCALQMGLRHPRMFRAVGDFSGDDHPWVTGGLRYLFWGQTLAQRAAAEAAYDPRALLAQWHESRAPAIVFIAGNDDRVLPKMQRLVAAANADGIDAHLVVLHGGHTFWLWRKSFAAALPWMMTHLSPPSG